MGSDPKQSASIAINARHDHQSLYLIGSGIFPPPQPAIESLTIAALALRTADTILKLRPQVKVFLSAAMRSRPLPLFI